MNQLLTVDEAAQFLRPKKSTIRMWIFRGKIPKVKLGRCVRIPKDDLEHLIKSNTYPNKQAGKEEKMSDKAARDVAAGRSKSSGIYKRYSKREGGWVWIGRLYQDGKRYRTKPYETKSEVKEALSRLRIDAKERKKPAEKATFAACAAEFMEHAKLLNRNYQGHFYCMVHLKPFFKGKKLDEITRAAEAGFEQGDRAD